MAELVDPNFPSDNSRIKDAGIRRTPMVVPIVPGRNKQELDAIFNSTNPQTSIEDIYNGNHPVKDDRPKGTGSDAYVGTQLGLLNAAMKNTDPVDEIEQATARASQTTEPQSFVASELYKYLGSLVELQAAAGAKVALETNDPAETERAAQETTALAQTVEKPGALENVVGTALRGQRVVTPEQSMLTNAFNLANFKGAVIAEEAGINGEWDDGEIRSWIQDAASMFFVPGRESISLLTFINQNDKGEVFSGVGGYKNAVKNFHDMPYAEQEAQFPSLSKYIMELSNGNKLLYLTLIDPFKDKEGIDSYGVGSINFDVAMDAGEFALIGVGWGIRAWKLAAKAMEARKAVGTLAGTGNREAAARLAARILKDPRVRKATGIEAETAAADAQPIDLTEVIPGQTPDLAESIMKTLEEDIVTRFNGIDESFTNLRNPDLIPQYHFFDDALKRQREEAVVGKLQDYPTFARIIDRDETGFTVETTTVSKYDAKYNAEDLRYQNELANKTIVELQDDLARRNLEAETSGDVYADTLRDRLAGLKKQVRKNEAIISDLEAPPTVGTQVFKYGIDEFGQLDAEVIKGTNRLNSPDLWMNQLTKDFVGWASIFDAQGSMVSKYLANAWNSALRGLDLPERKALSLWLEKGARDEKVFTPAELAEGIHTSEGLTRARSPKQIAAYYGARRVLDQLHTVREEMVARKLDVEGFTHEMALRNLKDGDGKMMRALVNPEDARSAIPAEVKRVYSQSTGKLEDVTDELRQMVADGKTSLYKFRNAVRHGGEEVTYGVAKPTTIRPRRAKVLNYVKGYVPRSYKNTWYVARKTANMLVDGVSTPRTTTERFFSTLDEANLWQSQQTDSSAYKIVRDREYVSSHPSASEEMDFNTFGGLYTGQRSDRDLLMGIDGKEPLMKNPIEAIEGYLSHISTNMPINEFRMSIVAKFQKSYGKYLPDGWAGDIYGLSKSDPLYKSIKQAQDYLVDFLRIRTVEERQWQNAMYKISETMSSIPGLKGTAQKLVLDNLASRDPITALRGAAFHSLLGFFNPRQFLIQALGAVIVHAVDPIRAPKYWGEYSALRAAMFVKTPEAWAKAGEHAELTGDFAELVRQWNRTGLKDSVTSYGDYNSAINGFGMTAQAFGKAASASTLPFREGELFVRGMGWLMARDAFLRAKPKGYKITKVDEAKILKDSYKHTMNLGRANRAGWQKGIMSVPTQFWQITTKFVENMLPELFGVPKNVRNWTPAERAKILFYGTILPFGAAGVPFARSAIGQFSDLYNEGKAPDQQVRGIEDANLFSNFGMSKESWTRLVDQGMAGLAGWYLTGDDLTISSRGSIAAGVEETIRNFKDADGVWDMAFAASGTPINRTWAALNTISAIWAVPDWTFSEYKVATNDVLSITSTWSNLHKAMWWNSMGKISDSKGRTIDDLDPNEDFSMLVWQALGFAPGRIDYLNGITAYTRNVEGGIDKAAKGIIQEKADAITTILVKYGAEVYSPEREKHMRIVIAALMQDLDPHAPIRDKIIERVNAGLLGSDSKLQTVLEKGTQAKMESRENAVGIESVFTNPLFVEKGQ